MPPGYEGVRAWIDADVQNPREFGPSAAKGTRPTYLALSGGGGNGAYGAGILNGWTHSGQRPTFTAVSGVSTGALIAPFAFLGPSYDGQLKAIYTDGIASSLVQAPDFLRVLTGGSLFGQGRLLDLVSRYVDPEMVEAIAREHRKGRRLYVVTTNLDSKRGVVWNVGAIAVSGRPGSIDLIRQVIAASASVPIVFSPELIDAEAGGHVFQEMHADGNVTTSVFTLPQRYLAAQRKTPLSGGAIYIVMNTAIEPKFSVVEDLNIKITAASIDTLLTQTTLEGLLATYAYTQANHVDFNVTSISPADISDGAQTFDTAYMRRLYDIGYSAASRGGFWQKTPLPDDRQDRSSRTVAVR
jgi:predicted acylesterase/phospholipase RssA